MHVTPYHHQLSVPTSPASFSGLSFRAVPSGVARIIARIMGAAGKKRQTGCWTRYRLEFSQRHRNIRELFLERFVQVRESLPTL